MTTERCSCGDTACPSCGTAQGTYAPPVPVTEDRYREACEGYEGWCDVCGDFTRDCTEPDAEGYACGQCETINSVCGAEQALLTGKLTIGGDDA